MTSQLELFVLGVAQDGGLPHLGCTQPCCINARQSGRVETPACMAIRNVDTRSLLLLEATPSITSQVALLHALIGTSHGEKAMVDAIAITHAHTGHYTGLMHLGKEGAATDQVPVHVSMAVANVLQTNAPWSGLVDGNHIALETFEPGRTFEPLQGIAIEPVAVPHRDELSDTMAFKVHGAHCTALFCPDIDAWGCMLEPLLCGVDVAFIDGTFFDDAELDQVGSRRDRQSIPHPTMMDTMLSIESMGKARPRDVRFIHLNHSNATFHGGRAAQELADRGFRVAKTGDRIDL